MRKGDFFLIIVHHFREKSSCSVLWELQKLFFTISFSNLKTCHQYLRNLCRMYILSLLIDLGKFAQILGRWNHWQYFQMYQEFFLNKHFISKILQWVFKLADIAVSCFHTRVSWHWHWHCISWFQMPSKCV